MSTVGRDNYLPKVSMVVSAEELSGCGSSSVSITAEAGTGEHHGQVGAGYGKELLCQTAHVLRCCLARVGRFQEQRQQLGCIYLSRRRSTVCAKPSRALGPQLFGRECRAGTTGRQALASCCSNTPPDRIKSGHQAPKRGSQPACCAPRAPGPAQVGNASAEAQELDEKEACSILVLVGTCCCRVSSFAFAQTLRCRRQAHCDLTALAMVPCCAFGDTRPIARGLCFERALTGQVVLGRVWDMLLVQR